jgi:hypothetical protein
LQFIKGGCGVRLWKLKRFIAGRVMVILASEGGNLQSQIEKWKAEGIQIKYLDKNQENTLEQSQ